MGVRGTRRVDCFCCYRRRFGNYADSTQIRHSTCHVKTVPEQLFSLIRAQSCNAKNAISRARRLFVRPAA